MKLCSLQCLEILSSAEDSLIQRRLKAAKLIPETSASRLLPKTIQSDRVFPRIRGCDRRHDELFDQVEDIYSRFREASSIAYRPFEIFWSNPYEPQHTALLKYFIDPEEDHDCGEALLKSLFMHLGLENLPLDGCKVSLEEPATYSGDGAPGASEVTIGKIDDTSDRRPEVQGETAEREAKRGFIDILIVHEAKDERERYAVVIENKVNEAGDTDQQLKTYVGYLQDVHKFPRVFVSYLPLRGGKEPSENSRGGIDTMDGVYFQINTFEDHILPWLKDTCRNAGLDEGMRDNLKHYRDLIEFRIKKDKEQNMHTDILKCLRVEEDKNGSLPAFKDVLGLRGAINELIQCYQRRIRAKLLYRMREALDHDGAELFVADGVYDTMHSLSASANTQDELENAKWCAVGIRVNDAIVAVVGFNIIENDDRVKLDFGARRISGKTDAALSAFMAKTPDMESAFGTLRYSEDGAWYHWPQPGPDYYAVDELESRPDIFVAALRKYVQEMKTAVRGLNPATIAI